MLTFAERESVRFGLRTFRASPVRVDAERLFEELVTERADLAIIRTPIRIPNGLSIIEARGFPVLHAGALASYECALAAHQPRPRENPRLRIDPAQPEDTDAILALVRAVFVDYPNHYRANPLLPADATIAGYGEWAVNHLTAAGRIAWVGRIDDRIAAISCSTFDDSGLCQGTLHGVHPDFVGSGIYTDLIRHTQQQFRERGFRTLRIQTQIGNLPVQRVWQREGFALAQVFDTFHINALLDTEAGSCVSGRLIASVQGAAHADSRTDVATRFLATAMELASRCGAHPSVPSEPNYGIAIWAPLDVCADFRVRVRVYDTASGANAVSATLHTADGKPCGIARVAR